MFWVAANRTIDFEIFFHKYYFITEISLFFNLLFQAESAKRVTYCEQVSCQQFEQQKLTDSQHALSDLLEQILQDTKMPPKEKRKHLKMVTKPHPLYALGIYYFVFLDIPNVAVTNLLKQVSCTLLTGKKKTLKT